MRHSGCAVYLHFVWATKYREPAICAEWEANLYRIIRSETLRVGCSVLAINGTEDHLHLLVQLDSTVAVSRLVNQTKGVSSSFINEQRRKGDEQARFRWQNGYGVCSVGPNQIARVIAYIHRQKEHHAQATTHTAWEPSGTCS